MKKRRGVYSNLNYILWSADDPKIFEAAKAIKTILDTCLVVDKEKIANDIHFGWETKKYYDICEARYVLKCKKMLDKSVNNICNASNENMKCMRDFIQDDALNEMFEYLESEPEEDKK